MIGVPKNCSYVCSCRKNKADAFLLLWRLHCTVNLRFTLYVHIYIVCTPTEYTKSALTTSLSPYSLYYKCIHCSVHCEHIHLCTMFTICTLKAPTLSQVVDVWSSLRDPVLRSRLQQCIMHTACILSCSSDAQCTANILHY